MKPAWVSCQNQEPTRFRQLFAAGHRLAQEHVGWEFLEEKTVMD
jgi:hypothetical protein